MNRCCDQEAAEKEEDRSRGIVAHGVDRGCNIQKRIKQDRQHRRDGNRQRFAEPPDGHQGRDCRTGLACVAELDHFACRIDKSVGQQEVDEDGEHRPQDKRPDLGRIRDRINRDR